MNSEIDDALRNERGIEPSGEFRPRVMRAVHARGAIGRPVGRVWHAVWPVVAVGSVVVALLMAVTLLERSEVRPGEMTQIAQWLSFTLTGTFAIVWRTMRRIVCDWLRHKRGEGNDPLDDLRTSTFAC